MVVKLYLVDSEITEDIQLENNKNKLPLPQTETELQPVKCGRGRLRKYPIKINTANISIYLQDEDND